MYELISTWKSTFVVINGEVTDRKIMGGLNYCYGDKIRSGNSNFCFGASYMTDNPFGCHRLQISSANNPWWTFGEFNKKGIWVIDKDSILLRINEYSAPYVQCPSFSMERVLEGLDSLPDFINPKRNRDWINNENGVEPKNSGSYEIDLINLTTDKPKKEGFISSILKLTGLKK